jgi:SulP family sulfate permease
VPRAGNVRLTEFVESDDHHVRERLEDDEPDARVLIFGFEGELFFGSAATLEQHADTIEARLTPQTRVVLLRTKRLRNPDAVGLSALSALVNRLRERGVEVLLAGVRPALRVGLERAGGTALLREDHIFLERPVRQTSTQEAMRYARVLLASPTLATIKTAEPVRAG